MTATQEESFTSGERLQNLRTVICEKSVKNSADTNRCQS